MDKVWFDECVSTDELKAMPKWKIGRICKEIQQEKQAQAREDYRNFIKTKMKKRGKR